LLAAVLVAVLAATGTAPAAAEPTVVRVEVGVPVSHPVAAGGWKAFVDAATHDAKGSFDFRLFTDGVFAAGDQGISGLAQGKADMGFLALPSLPESFPYAALVSELGMIGDDALATAAAVTELFMLRCPSCSAQFRDHNLVFLGSYAASPYVLIGREPLATVESMRARRVLTPGSLWDRWSRSVGAEPVESVRGRGQALSRNMVDAVIDIADALTEGDSEPAALTVTTPPLGSYTGASPFTVNRDFWRSLDAKRRAVLFGAAASGIVATTEAYAERGQAALAAAAEAGATVAEADPAMVAQAHAFVRADLPVAAAAAGEQLGIPDAAEVAALFRDLYGQWVVRLGPPVMTSEDAARAVWQHIFGRIDAATYGTARAGTPDGNG